MKGAGSAQKSTEDLDEEARGPSNQDGAFLIKTNKQTTLSYPLSLFSFVFVFTFFSFL